MKISFVDFWSGFDPNNNFLFFLFREIYENLEVVNPINSNLIIYSCFGNEHLKYSQKKYSILVKILDRILMNAIIL